MKILFRIIVFPAVAMIGLASALRLWFSFCLNFLANGGEIVAFTNKSRHTIAHVLEIVEAKHEQDRITTAAWMKTLREMKLTEVEEDQPIEIIVNYEKA